jgi:hypothetical protein
MKRTRPRPKRGTKLIVRIARQNVFPDSDLAEPAASALSFLVDALARQELARQRQNAIQAHKTREKREEDVA